MMFPAYLKNSFMRIEFITMNPKEIKVTNPVFMKQKPFVFGKLNVFRMFSRWAPDDRDTLFSRGSNNGVEIRTCIQAVLMPDSQAVFLSDS
jgi:hypothetical protein